MQQRDIFNLSRKDEYTYVIIKKELTAKIVFSSTDLKYSIPYEY